MGSSHHMVLDRVTLSQWGGRGGLCCFRLFRLIRLMVLTLYIENFFFTSSYSYSHKKNQSLYSKWGNIKRIRRIRRKTPCSHAQYGRPPPVEYISNVLGHLPNFQQKEFPWIVTILRENLAKAVIRNIRPLRLSPPSLLPNLRL